MAPKRLSTRQPRVKKIRIIGTSWTVALPGRGALITQDLASNHVHALLGERRFDGWAAALREHMELPYNTILCGHGLPGGKELYDGMLNYLAAGDVTLGKAVDGDDLKARLSRQFPDGIVLLDHQKRFLFTPQQH